jgi:hypothetical protein
MSSASDLLVNCIGSILDPATPSRTREQSHAHLLEYADTVDCWWPTVDVVLSDQCHTSVRYFAANILYTKVATRARNVKCSYLLL